MRLSKCEGGGSVVLERPLKLWSLIIDSVRCGGGIQRPCRKKSAGSDKLSELLKQPEWWENDEEVRRKEEVLQGLKNVAKKLQQQESMEGAAEVRRLTKDDPHARTTLALLGVIPPLVALLHSPDPTSGSQIAALYALLNLAIANDENKAAIVKAGAVDKMVKLIIDESPNEQDSGVAEAVVANFLGLSALDSNKPIIGSSGAIPFLVETLVKDADGLSGQDSLRALYNLSIFPPNVLAMLETDLIPHLFARLGDMEMSERVLCILGNIVSVGEGRKRMSRVADVFPALLDVFNWTDSPACQEKACYILMVMAHKSYADRQAMIDAGVVSSLLELTLLGTTLAQKRASRMLECLREDKGKQQQNNTDTLIMSAPQQVAAPNYDDDNDDEMMSQEKKAVKQLVQQSLHKNMRRMVKRANLAHDFVPSHHFNTLTLSSTSKSLPF
ncbi:hypothetical protein ACS0TY_030842 [Phlomoides rotata]